MHQTLTVGDRSRSFVLVEPEGPRRPRDLVIIFHGSKQSGSAHRRFTGGMFDALATRDGAVVVYPDGYRGNWNDARRESFFPARRAGIDDVGFVRALVARLVETHGVDPARVFAVGYSNGGQMAMRLALEAPVLVAGAAVVAATLPAPDSLLLTAPADPRPLPILLVHGTKDPIVPYAGGTMSRWARLLFRVGGTTLSAPETARWFATRSGITAPPATERVPTARVLAAPGGGGRTWVERTAYRQTGLPPVTLYTVHGGGHTVPGPTPAPRMLGRTSSDVSTAALVAELFGIGGSPHPA